MKAHSPILLHARTALGATAFFIAALTAIAQSGGAGSGNYNTQTSGTTGTTGTSANETARRNSQTSPSVSGGTSSSSSAGSSDASSPTSSTGSTYGSGTTGTAATGTSFGATSANRTMSGSDKLTWGDKRFVTRAADHGMAEIQVAELAAQQATNPDVKAFAQQLLQAHTAVNQELMAIASTKQVQIDKDDGKDRAFRRLSGKSGEEFDREFIEQQIDQHEADIKLFGNAAQNAKDQELRSFASKHVGHLREHLQKAQSLQASLVPTGRTDRAMRTDSTTSSTSTGSGTTGTTHSAHATGPTGTGNPEASKPQGGSTPEDSSSPKANASNDADSTDRSKRGAP